jgi:uncharacterized paraquat-inducible protein A
MRWRPDQQQKTRCLYCGYRNPHLGHHCPLCGARLTAIVRLPARHNHHWGLVLLLAGAILIMVAAAVRHWTE